MKAKKISTEKKDNDTQNVATIQAQPKTGAITLEIPSVKTASDIKLRLLLINGPNLNMLGRRDPEKYGSFTLADVEKLASDTAFKRGYKIDCFQSNYEGAIIEKIHEAMDLFDGIVINPGALTHYSYSIRDALELCALPVVETHISDIEIREDFRKISVTAPVCIAQIKGYGIDSYARAVETLCDHMEHFLRK